MNTLITELKTRARLRLNAVRRGDLGLVDHARTAADSAPASVADWRLRHCLTLVANEVGFRTWEQARHVLGARAVAGEDMGTFWHTARCNGLLNQWFASYTEARTFLEGAPRQVLLPYRRQFVVADENYLRVLGMSLDDENWHHASRDLVSAQGTRPWLTLSTARLRATRQSFCPAVGAQYGPAQSR